MSLRTNLFDAKVAAMKAKDHAALKVLRVLCADIQNQELEVRAELSDEQTIALVKTLVKRLKEALSDFSSAGREELVAETQTEINLLTTYLPEMMSDEQIRVIIIEELQNLENPNIGQLMGAVMKKAKGQADGTRVRELVTEALS